MLALPFQGQELGDPRDQGSGKSAQSGNVLYGHRVVAAEPRPANGGASGAVAPGSSQIGGNSMTRWLAMPDWNGARRIGPFNTVAKVARRLGGALRR